MPLGTMILGTLGTVAGIDVAIAWGGAVVALLALTVLVRVAPVRDLGRA